MARSRNPNVALVPEPAPRVLGLVRVSKERDGMVAPEIQVHAIETYANARGYLITRWLEGLDESGSRARSAWWPRLDQAVKLVEDGVVDVIVVWKYSRTARNRLKWAVALDRVESAGGRIESATEQVDTTTSTGRFTRGMLAELNAFEAERIGEVWKEAHARRVRSGRPHSGRPRYGYTYDRDQKLHLPHPEQAPLLVEMYRRYIAGESMASIAAWLNRHGHRSTQDRPWNDTSVRAVLDAGFAAGWFEYGGQRHKGVHESLIDEETWQAYLDARTLRKTVPARRQASRHLLSGLLRCMRCGNYMSANLQKPRWKTDRRSGVPRKVFVSTSHLNYVCLSCKQLGTGPTGTVSATVVEPLVMDYLRSLATCIDEAAETVSIVHLHRANSRNEYDRLSADLARAEAALVRLAVDQAERPIPVDLYARSHQELTERVETLRMAVEIAGAHARRAIHNPAETAAGLLEAWDTLPVRGRREILAKLLDCVVVQSGRPPRLVLVPAWEVRREVGE